MTLVKKLIIIGGALAVFATAFVLKEFRSDEGKLNPEIATASTAALPRLLDLGSDSCVPCKMMAPILENLRKEYDGRMIVEFIDVRRNRDVGIKYGIKVIPTQIFYAADGQELTRHEGFMSREDILETWDKFGVDVESGVPRKDRE
jgi:thioredoxin 1